MAPVIAVGGEYWEMGIGVRTNLSLGISATFGESAWQSWLDFMGERKASWEKGKAIAWDKGRLDLVCKAIGVDLRLGIAVVWSCLKEGSTQVDDLDIWRGL